MRFSEFSDEWENKKLGDLMTFKVTNSYSRDNLNYESGIVKNIHYGDIHTKFQTLFDLEKENVPYINEDISLNRISKDFYCQEGDVIFADASEDLNDVGKSIEITNLNGEKLLSGLHTLLARPQKNNFSKGFLGYLLKSDFVRNQIKRESQGSKVLSINVARISNIHLVYPSIPEQQKISEFLSLLDERIQTQKKIISQLKSQMSNLKDLLFEQKLRFKDNNENEYPDWRTFRLCDLGNTYNGLSGKTKEDFGSGQKYIQYKQIFDSDKIKIANCAFVNVEENENQNKVKYGDAFFTISSETPDEIGMSSVLLENIDNVYLNSFCFGFRTYSFSELIPEFSQFFFRSSKFRNEIVKLAQGSTRYNMSKIEFLKLKVKLPFKDEQIKIAQFLSSISEKINIETELLAQYENQKKYLLKNLFV
ncbi:restriction endonuclease subunit S [Chryseobacterium hispalense]|uniref:restriction endonuclease subunit S n=1 Tax=Chryseobacterium hispalense TaxID=1453492 RepID=UPI0009E79EB5|nr:restriction endonuclease subunit S [Chryseobacterium hispalense]